MGWIKTRISLLKNENGNNNIKISIHKTLPILGCVSGIQAKTSCFACNSTQLALNLALPNLGCVYHITKVAAG